MRRRTKAVISTLAGIITLAILGPLDEILFATFFGYVLFGLDFMTSLLIGALVGIVLFVGLELLDVTNVTDAF